MLNNLTTTRAHTSRRSGPAPAIRGAHLRKRAHFVLCENVTIDIVDDVLGQTVFPRLVFDPSLKGLAPSLHVLARPKPMFMLGQRVIPDRLSHLRFSLALIRDRSTPRFRTKRHIVACDGFLCTAFSS